MVAVMQPSALWLVVGVAPEKDCLPVTLFLNLVNENCILPPIP